MANNSNDSHSNSNAKMKSRLDKIIDWIYGIYTFVYKFFTFRKYYYQEAIQAFCKVESEYNVLKQNVASKQNSNQEEKDAIVEIDSLIAKAKAQKTYSELWPYIHLIELQILRLYDFNSLSSYLPVVLNNLSTLEENAIKQWDKALEEFKNIKGDNDKEVDRFRKVLYAITSEINEERRTYYMTNDLKRGLMKRLIWITGILGLIAWVFVYSIIRDSLIHYAVLLGVLGGFFSRLFSTQNLAFKPPAFSLLAQYTYVQPLLGGIGALILYIILISPIGPEVVSNNTFYIPDSLTQKYVYEHLSDSTSIIHIKALNLIRDSTFTKQVITKYPKPGLFLVLAFLAGFSERWFLGTLESIVGNRLKKKDSEQHKADKTT